MFDDGSCGVEDSRVTIVRRDACDPMIRRSAGGNVEAVDAPDLESNRAVVLRFNRAVIERGDETAFRELMAPDFVNHTAPPGVPKGPEGMWSMLSGVLRPAFPDLRVEIHEQIAEGDLVTTRKSLVGTHAGPLFDLPPTGRPVRIEVIDIVRVRGGRYVEHWGMNTLMAVAAELRSPVTWPSPG